MLGRFTNSLIRLIGRTKKHMDALYLGFGGILIPLGFSLLFVTLNNDKTETSLIAFGIGCVIAGIVFWLLAYKEVKEKEEADIAVRNEDRHLLIDALHREFESLKQYLDNRGKEHGIEDSDKPK